MTGPGDVPMCGTAPSGSTLWADWSALQMPLTLTFHGATGPLTHTDIAPHTSGRTALPDAPTGFVMAELRATNDILHAISNPILIG